MRAFWLLPLLLAAVPAAEPAAAEEPVRTEPGHMNSLPQFYIAPQPGLPRTRYRRAQVVYRLPKPLPELAVRDNALSRLCQRGAFIQEMNGFYWARTPERTYGVAFSGGANLVDPQNRRAPGKVYFFDGQDARCTVWVGEQAGLMEHYVGPLPGD